MKEDDEEKLEENVMENRDEGEDNVLLISLPIVLVSCIDERKEGQGADEIMGDRDIRNNLLEVLAHADGGCNPLKLVPKVRQIFLPTDPKEAADILDTLLADDAAHPFLLLAWQSRT